MGILETANSIYKRYRNVFMSQGLNKELVYSQQFIGPLLNTFKFPGQLNSDMRKLAVNMGTLMCFI